MKSKKADHQSYSEKTLNLLALATLDGKTLKEQVVLMSRAGFGPTEMARMLGSTPKSISVRLAEIRRAGGRGKRGA